MNQVARGAIALTGLVAALAFTPAVARAQATDSPWRANYFPYPGSAPNDWPMLGLWYSYRQQADYYSPTATTGELTADGGIAWHGSWRLALSFRAPQLWPKWRLVAMAGVAQDNRFGYFGLGNDAPFDNAIQNDSTSEYYRTRRLRYGGMAEVSRDLLPHLRLALAASGEYSRFRPEDGPSLFRTDFAGAEVAQSEAAGRMTLVYDSRDKEFNPSKGLFIEASALTAAGLSSGTAGYGRYTLIARGYVSVREGTVLTARLGGSSTSGTPSFGARYEVPSWESQPLSALGGARTQRALVEGRYAGQHVLLAGAEVRHDLLNAGDFGAITLIAFLDAGRVFENEAFKLTFDGMKVGGGGGVALRFMRLSTFTFNFAGGPDGFNFTAGTGWSF
jgi:outer membrane protein assembly factor BamA